ncbi:MAG: hypothetical protein IPM02_02180 [Betaproteobacteria bacterium]|nr:hypothetical protein [Betaproteobacteria bacterium]
MERAVEPASGRLQPGQGRAVQRDTRDEAAAMEPGAVGLAGVPLLLAQVPQAEFDELRPNT